MKHYPQLIYSPGSIWYFIQWKPSEHKLLKKYAILWGCIAKGCLFYQKKNNFWTVSQSNIWPCFCLWLMPSSRDLSKLLFSKMSSDLSWNQLCLLQWNILSSCSLQLTWKINKISLRCTFSFIQSHVDYQISWVPKRTHYPCLSKQPHVLSTALDLQGGSYW